MKEEREQVMNSRCSRGNRKGEGLRWEPFNLRKSQPDGVAGEDLAKAEEG